MFCYSSKIESEVGVRRVFCYSSKVESEVGVVLLAPR